MDVILKLHESGVLQTLSILSFKDRIDNAAYRTGLKVTFDEKTQKELLAGGKPFKYVTS